MADKNNTGKPFPLIIQELDEEKIKQCISEGYDINARIDKNGRTLLIEAAEAGNTEIVRLLVKYGADVNIPEKKEKKTALLLACWEGHESAVKVLIENNADVHHKKSGDKTSLMYAAHSGKPGIVKLLIEKGVALDAVNDEGVNALMYAADSDKKFEAFKVIVEAGADINLRDNEGKPVISAVQYSTLLMRHGCRCILLKRAYGGLYGLNEVFIHPVHRLIIYLSFPSFFSFFSFTYL